MKKKRLLQTVCVLVLACLTLTLCACSSKTERYNELIVGDWKTNDDVDIYSFYHSGKFKIDEEGRWKIEGDKLILYNEYYKVEAKIRELDEEKLVLEYDGITEYYYRISFQPSSPN